MMLGPTQRFISMSPLTATGETVDYAADSDPTRHFWPACACVGSPWLSTKEVKMGLHLPEPGAAFAEFTENIGKISGIDCRPDIASGITTYVARIPAIRCPIRKHRYPKLMELLSLLLTRVCIDLVTHAKKSDGSCVGLSVSRVVAEHDEHRHVSEGFDTSIGEARCRRLYGLPSRAAQLGSGYVSQVAGAESGCINTAAETPSLRRASFQLFVDCYPRCYPKLILRA